MTTAATKERPILFSGEMVRAILDGRKTMTRRVMKPQPILVDDGQTWDWPKIVERVGGHDISAASWAANLKDLHLEELCPYGKPGDHLWVRETWQLWDINPGVSDLYDVELIDQPLSTFRRSYFKETQVVYRASRDNDERWRPSIHMPRWASRITLEVTGVRVERVQEIGIYDVRDEGLEIEGLIAGFEIESDGRADGCQYDEPDDFVRAAKKEFARLWDSINAKRGYSFESNRWVWVIEFKHVKGDGDAQ